MIEVGLIPSVIAAVILVAAAFRSWHAPSGKASGLLARASRPTFLLAVAAIFLGSALLEVSEDPKWFFALLGLAVLFALIGCAVVFTGRPAGVVPPAARGAPGVATIIDAWAHGDTGDRDLLRSVLRGGLTALVLFILVAGATVALLVPRPTSLGADTRLADARVLQVTYQTCNARSYIRADESRDRVAIAVWTRFNTRNDCLDGTTILLEEPLGDRQVIDAKTDKQLFVIRPSADDGP